MKILVIGSGGREHALAWALKSSSSAEIDLYCAPGNAGIGELATCVPISATDVNRLVSFAEEQGIDLTIVGGEASLAAGVADLFRSKGLPIAGPDARAARLESSKVFAKSFMAKHGIPTARHRVANSITEAIDILESGHLAAADQPIVIKADGLAAGKGVVVAKDRNEAIQAVKDILEGDLAGQALVIEEALTGKEASLLLFSDGRDFALMPAARDHKRIGEGDTGPNTGGMGTITGTEVLDDSTLKRAVDEIVVPTLEGFKQDGLDFRGILFIGLMLTPDGPKVLEYNVRFGDPEAQAILVTLESNLVNIFKAVAEGGLKDVPVRWSGKPSACVVLAAPGYPQKPDTGMRIEGLETAQTDERVRIFHAGTAKDEKGNWITAGGRVLGITATGSSLDEALDTCYSAISRIHSPGIQFRRDIGK
jgi:phosphoribosylamine---glycine ligase